MFFFSSGSDYLTLVDKYEEVEGGNKETGRKDSNMVAGTPGHLINLYCDNRAKVKKVKDLLMITSNLPGKQKVCNRMFHHSQAPVSRQNTMSYAACGLDLSHINAYKMRGPQNCKFLLHFDILP